MSAADIPTPPKRPANAYFRFQRQVYDDVRSKNPDLKITEYTKIISEMYKTLEEKKKKALEDVYAKEMAVYKDEKAKYDAKYGEMIKKEKKKAKKSVVSDSDEESQKKKKGKSKKADNEDKKKDDKKGKKNGGDKKDSKPDKDKKGSKAEPEAKKGNKKK